MTQGLLIQMLQRVLQVQTYPGTVMMTATVRASILTVRPFSVPSTILQKIVHGKRALYTAVLHVIPATKSLSAGPDGIAPTASTSTCVPLAKLPTPIRKHMCSTKYECQHPTYP